LGQDALAATNVAFSISTLAFMPIMSMGQTASILVGQHLGGDRPDVAECATWTTASLAIGYMLVVSAMYVLVPGLLVGAFFLSEANGSRQDIGALAAVLMRYVAAYNLFDAMNLVFSGAIKGAGDMRFVFVTSFWMAIVLVSTTWAALYWFQSGIHGCWTVVTLWVCVLGLVYAWRFRQGAWKTMRVIG
jgi:MATE family multidrug resistance protein